MKKAKEVEERQYSEEICAQTIKTFYSVVNGRGVGNLLGMNKSNVHNWIKNDEINVENTRERIFNNDGE